MPAMWEIPVQFLGREHTLEKATHSSILGLSLWLSWWRIWLQWGRPGFGPRVGMIPWRRERLPTPVFWPGEFHGLHSSWDCKESDTTEKLSLSLFISYPRVFYYSSLNRLKQWPVEAPNTCSQEAVSFWVTVTQLIFWICKARPLMPWVCCLECSSV